MWKVVPPGIEVNTKDSQTWALGTSLMPNKYHAFLLCSCHSGVAVPQPPQSQSCALKSIFPPFSQDLHTIIIFAFLSSSLISCSLAVGNENCSSLLHANGREIEGEEINSGQSHLGEGRRKGRREGRKKRGLSSMFSVLNILKEIC